MMYFWLLMAAALTALAIERTVDVFIAVRRGYLHWRLGCYLVIFVWLPVAAGVFLVRHS